MKEAAYGGLDHLKAGGEEEDRYAQGGEGLELGVAVGMILVRRTGGQAEAHQANDIGGAVEERVQSVGGHAQGSCKEAVGTLDKGNKDIYYEYYYEEAPDSREVSALEHDG